MSKREKHSLEPDEADDILRKFVHHDEPHYVEDIGATYLSGGYYWHWERNDGTKYITYSRQPTREAEQFFVKAWSPIEHVTNQDSYKAIKNHAAGYQEAVITHGVLKKTRFRFNGQGRDVYDAPHQNYEVHFDETDRIQILKNLIRGRHGHSHKWHPRIQLWKTNRIKPFTRRESELVVSHDFVQTLKPALASQWQLDPELRHTKPIQFYWAAALRVGGVFRRKLFPGLERIDSTLGIRDNVFAIGSGILGGQLTLTLMGRFLLAVSEVLAFVRPEEQKNWPGFVRSKDYLARELSLSPDYAYPLGGLLRPMRAATIKASRGVNNPYFGRPALETTIHRIKSFAEDGINGLSAAYWGPTIGSTVRFYWSRSEELADDPHHDIEAVRVYRPDGLTITIFGQSRIWISHEKERAFDKDADIPAALMAHIREGFITEIAQRSHGAMVEQLSLEKADRVFRSKFGSPRMEVHRPQATKKRALPVISGLPVPVS